MVNTASSILNRMKLDEYVPDLVLMSIPLSAHNHRAIKLFRRAVVEKYPLDVVSNNVAIHGLLKSGRI
ncbi:hypothetical protein V6N12_007052 [Hibiscus sabdariffa]|uniref:Uncharacterized protein n=1 Tax=Hibiscus sabdariffa TaxID=183260 RepID=A0ABR2F0N6_9ROSI